MSHEPIRWEVLDDNMAIRRIDDHVVLARSIALPTSESSGMRMYGH